MSALDEKMTAGEWSLVASLTVVLSAIILPLLTILLLPLLILNAWAINTVLRWHYPAFAVGVIPIAALLLVARTASQRHPEHKDDREKLPLWQRVLAAVLTAPLLLLSGWLLLIARRWFA